MRLLSLVLAVVMTLSIAGCSKRSSGMEVAVHERKAASGNTPFLINQDKMDEDGELYIENFQKALNERNVEAITEFLSLSDSTSKAYVEYLKDKSMRSLIEFYLASVDLEYLKTVEISGQPYIAVEASYFDNRYNDFNSVNIVRGENPRQEFYDTVTSMIEKQKALVEGSEDFSEEKEQSGLSMRVSEDISIPTSTSHIGVDYNNAQELKQWTDTLNAEKDGLRRFSRIMFFKVLDGAEFSTIDIDRIDLIALFGSIPAFFGLNSRYSIESYDMFYNFTKFWESLPENEQLAYTTWDSIRGLDDEQVRAMVEHDAKDGTVFGKFDIETDIDAIRQNLLPAELGIILDTYYNGAGRAYYTFMYENDEYSRLEQNLFRNMSVELIRQKDKTFIVLVTLPDINRLVLNINEGLGATEMVQKINELLENGDFETTSAYSRVVLQKEPGMKWGFKLMRNPMKDFLIDSVHSQILEATGITAWLGSTLDSNGYLADGTVEDKAGGGLFSDMEA